MTAAVAPEPRTLATTVRASALMPLSPHRRSLALFESSDHARHARSPTRDGANLLSKHLESLLPAISFDGGPLRDRQVEIYEPVQPAAKLLVDQLEIECHCLEGERARRVQSLRVRHGDLNRHLRSGTREGRDPQAGRIERVRGRPAD